MMRTMKSARGIWSLLSLAFALASAACALAGGSMAHGVSNPNAPIQYARVAAPRELVLDVEAGATLSRIDRRIFGSNLEWFNQAGGLANPDAEIRNRLIGLARDHSASVYRFPGGILADYYDWKDGTGPRSERPMRQHPSDSGSSRHTFGSPEFFEFLKRTQSEGLITVNAGTGTPEEAAAWVAYANKPGHEQRTRDGFAQPAGIKLWEIGNELYLPGNPQEKKITIPPEVYAARFIRFADAMRAVDPSITIVGIGVSKSHIGPDTEFPDWSDKLLKVAASKMDMLAVHNAYFPMLYKVKQPRVDQVYPALWASPEAVGESLANLDALMNRYEGKRHIGIAITEWGALFSLPRADPYWVDHVKTLGTGVYVGRMLQVFMSNPRVQMANYFKFADRSFMGWVDLNAQPKVPYWVFKLYAQNTGDTRVKSSMTAPETYNTPALGIMKPQNNVPEVTQVVTRDSSSGRLYVNLVNRSLSRVYSVRLNLKGFKAEDKGEILSVSGKEPTAHNGRDIPPEWPHRPEYEPYTVAKPGSIRLNSAAWNKGDPVSIPPFSVLTVVIDPA